MITLVPEYLYESNTYIYISVRIALVFCLNSFADFTCNLLILRIWSNSSFLLDYKLLMLAVMVNLSTPPLETRSKIESGLTLKIWTVSI
jgi:hypothetical protein